MPNDDPIAIYFISYETHRCDLHRSVCADVMALKIREISAEDVELVRMCWVLSGAKLCSIPGFDIAERDIR